MAGIAGIYCADGRPAEISELRRMVATVEHRGTDGIHYWNSGPVALAHMQFFTTPESLHEQQPLVNPGGDICLTWNGRLDNRDDLKAELEAAGARPADMHLRDTTDPGLVLASYLTWGTDCVQHFIGDFALAIWDARLRQLWCVCDYIGIRPFYYYWDGKTFLYGPDVKALLAHPLVSFKINEGMAAELITHQVSSCNETLFCDIRRLTPGFALTVNAAGTLKKGRWWNPELSLLAYATDEAYAEHFRLLMDQAVRSQMRCNTSWGIALSGGLDSSSIAVSARAVLQADGRGDDPILTFSNTSPGKVWDESEDIAATVEKAALTSEQMEPLRVGLDFFRKQASCWLDYPGTPNGAPMTLPLHAAAKRQGVRVLMTGFGGDELLDGTLAHLGDLAARLGSPSSLRALMDRAKHSWKSYSGEGRWQVFLVRKLLVEAAPDWALRQRKRQQLAHHSILSRKFVRRTHLAERITAPPEREPRHFATRAQQAVFRILSSGREAHVLAWNDREAVHAGMELRFPFLDRRLAEFCLRLPEEQRQQGAIWKRILRNAMCGRLPERVQMKMYKAEYSDMFDGVFSAPETQTKMQNLLTQQHTDWLDSRRLQEAISARLGLWPLWGMIATDLWFEQVTIAAGRGTKER